MKRIYSNYRPLFLTLLVSSCFTLIATGQTPVAVLENATGNTVLTSFEDGGLLLTGQLNTGTIPVEGPGVRMMWYPAKAAFRAGEVPDNTWDDSNVGKYSVAFGYETTASKNFSTAFGANTISSGNYSMAWGQLSQATEQYSTAFGYQSKATGINSTAWGLSTIATGENSTAWGQNTIASGEYSTAFGNNTLASGENSTAFGNNTLASGENSTAFGRSTTASDYTSTAFGAHTTASGVSSTAFGDQTTASGKFSTTFGLSTMASGENSTAFGHGTIAVTPSSLSIGQYNVSNTSSDGTLFVIGNGTDATNRFDAFRVEDNGNVFANVFTIFSDKRLKENIQLLENHTLEKLSKIHPVRYTFKNQQTKPAGDQIGMIAQEVQAQFPELVSEGSNGFLSLSYSNFTAVLLKGMQEQQAQIQDLQKQLEEKDRQIQNLQAKADLMDQFSERLARLEQQDPHPSSTDAD